MSDCKSVVDYVIKHRQTRLRNEVGKLPFLMAIQQYMQEEDWLKLRWVKAHPEERKGQMGHIHSGLLRLQKTGPETSEGL